MLANIPYMDPMGTLCPAVIEAQLWNISYRVNKHGEFQWLSPASCGIRSPEGNSSSLAQQSPIPGVSFQETCTSSVWTIRSSIRPLIRVDFSPTDHGLVNKMIMALAW